MRQQPSKRAIELRLEWLNKALGRPLKPNWGHREDPDKAAFYLDHQLGGYRLECAGHPTFGHQRMTKTQLVDQLEAILTAIRLARGEDTGAAWPQKAPDGSTIRPEELIDMPALAKSVCIRPNPGTVQEQVEAWEKSVRDNPPKRVV